MVDSRFWKEVAAKSKIDINEKYILTYFLYTSYYQDDIPYKFIESLKRKTGLRVYNVSLFNQTQSILADKHLNQGPDSSTVQTQNGYALTLFIVPYFHIFLNDVFLFLNRPNDNYCEEGCGNQNSSKA